jgi:hypothetical protein
MVVAARRQTAVFIQEIESSGFLPKAARQNSIVPCGTKFIFVHHQPLRSWLISIRRSATLRAKYAKIFF